MAASGNSIEAAEEAFSALGNQTRMQILLALWRAYDPFASDNAVPFSELFEAVGVDDSGQFNYHLGKLRERFVTRRETGYELTPVGL